MKQFVFSFIYVCAIIIRVLVGWLYLIDGFAEMLLIIFGYKTGTEEVYVKNIYTILVGVIFEKIGKYSMEYITEIFPTGNVSKKKITKEKFYEYTPKDVSEEISKAKNKKTF